MEHHHTHHHEHIHQITSLNRIFIAVIVLNLLFVAAEAGIGFYKNSLGLLSDAGHNLGDVFSLVLALIAFKLSKVPRNKRYTYGYKKSTVLISLLNAIILLVAVGAIIMESIRKIGLPAEVDGAAVSWTAGIGILINGVSAWLLRANQKNDINVRGAFLHMAADTLVSVGVVISGFIISRTGYMIVDPIVSLFIAFIILISTWHLLTESLRLSLDGIPEQINPDELIGLMRSVPHVTDVHHVHVWAVSTVDVALTAHLVIDRLSEMEAVKEDVRRQLETMDITHSTLEVETAETCCTQHECEW